MKQKTKKREKKIKDLYLNGDGMVMIAVKTGSNVRYVRELIEEKVSKGEIPLHTRENGYVIPRINKTIGRLAG